MLRTGGAESGDLAGWVLPAAGLIGWRQLLGSAAMILRRVSSPVLCLLLPVFVLMAGCSPPPPPPVQQARFLDDAPDEFPIVYGRAGVNDIAHFLAGRPVRRGELLSQMQQTAEYQLHQREMNAVWRQTGRHRVGRMEGWSYENLSVAVGRERVVMYPFGGPDLLHVSALFPQVPNYALMGLEPVGNLPDLESMPPGEVLGALAAFRQATRTQLRAGYFITKDMRSDLERSALQGVTPILLSTVAMTGGQVESVRGISAGGNPGVEVRYRSAAGGRHAAIYVAGDLSNSGFPGPYRDWLASLGSGVTYFKAASYLMHDDRFSEARQFFLTRSQAILQDDSGIPFRFLSGPDWGRRYFGNYQAPIDLFAKHAQADLRRAYVENPTSPLNFGSGYHVNPWEANLLLAVRR
jgi:hypothetical protein